MPTVASGMPAGPRLRFPRLALLQPAQEDVDLPHGLQVAVLLGHLAALREDAAGLGVLAQLEVGAAEHPVGDRVVRFVLYRASQVLPGLGVAPLLEKLDAQRAEDHGVVGFFLEQLAEYLRPRGLHPRTASFSGTPSRLFSTKGPRPLKRTPVDAERVLEELARSRDLERRSV